MKEREEDRVMHQEIRQEIGEKRTALKRKGNIKSKLNILSDENGK
jgi:hypothetical protein